MIVGKALYEGRFTVAEAQAALTAAPAEGYAAGGDQPLTGDADYPRRVHYKRVIPCLDVDAGRVVKGTNFVDIRDAGDPVELAARYDAEGADELVFLDITATSDKRDTVVELARRTADDVFIPFTIGGGIRSVADAQAVLDAGADKVSVNSAAVARPELIDELADVFGAQCVVLAIDAKRRRGGWEVYVAGGRTPTGRDAVSLGARGRRARGGGDPAHVDGPRRHQGRLRPRPACARSPARSTCRSSPRAARASPSTSSTRCEAGADAVLLASIFHYGQLHGRRGQAPPRRRRRAGAGAQRAVLGLSRDSDA